MDTQMVRPLPPALVVSRLWQKSFYSRQIHFQDHLCLMIESYQTAYASWLDQILSNWVTLTSQS
jgi:hypothetical protein